MQLRDHPLMTRKSGVVSWPPEWKPVNDSRDNLKGELGILEDVGMHDLITNKIFLVMTHSSDRYFAVMAFDDEIFAKQLYLLLLGHIGRSLHDIGALDLSHLL